MTVSIKHGYQLYGLAANGQCKHMSDCSHTIHYQDLFVLLDLMCNIVSYYSHIGLSVVFVSGSARIYTE